MIDDVWVLIDAKKPADALARIINPSAQGGLMLCKSNWHSISAQSMLSVSFISPPPTKSTVARQNFLKTLYAFNIMNITTYVQVIDNLIAFAKVYQEKPVFNNMNTLLQIREQQPDSKPHTRPLLHELPREFVLEKAEKICQEFAFNDDQKAYLALLHPL